MSKKKMKTNSKTKKADAFTRFSCSAELQQSHYIDLDISPIGHECKPPEDLAEHIRSEHGQSCVESQGKESGEIEWGGNRYSFIITSEVIGSDVFFEKWSEIEHFSIGGDQ